MALRHPRAILLLSAACFTALALAVLFEAAPAVDQLVRDNVLAAATPGLVAVMRVANYGGDKLVLVPGTLLLFAVFSSARHRWWVWVALMIAAPAAEGALKALIARPRPEGLGLAFPSGHATAAAAFFGAVFYLAGSLPQGAVRTVVRAAALVSIALVALARVVLRAHWPSDALAGVALGLALASAAALAAALQVRAGEG